MRSLNPEIRPDDATSTGARRQLNTRLALCSIVGIGATLPWCMLDVVVAWRATVQTFGLALALAVGGGLLLAVPTGLIARERPLAALAIWPLPLLTLGDVLWASDRAMHLIPTLPMMASWFQASAAPCD